MTELTRLTIAEARDGLAAKDFSAAELTDAYLDAIGGAEELNAYVAVTADKAREMAAKSDERIAAGERRRPTFVPRSRADSPLRLTPSRQEG